MRPFVQPRSERIHLVFKIRASVVETVPDTVNSEMETEHGPEVWDTRARPCPNAG